MAKVGSSSFGVLLVDGYNLLSAKLQSQSDEIELELEPSDGLGDSWREKSPTGMRTATLEQSGAFFDTTANAIHTAMSGVPSTERLVAWAVAGNTIGSIFKAAKGAFTSKYGVISSGAKLTKANVSYRVTGQLDEGVILQDHVAKTVDWNTKTDGSPVDYTLDPSQTVIPITSNSLANPSVVTTPVPHGLTTGDIVLISGVVTSTPTINGERAVTVISPTTFSVPVNVTVAGTGGSFVRSNSSNGGVGYQLVSSFSGFTGFVGKIRDSADDVTYADLITFGNVTTAPAAERQTVVGTIDRFLSFNGDVTGAGSIKPFVGFKRS